MSTVWHRIQKYNKDRNQQLLVLKYAAMKQSAFRFFRGTCHLFYEDFKSWQNWEDETTSWICGDLHIENFGTYKGDNKLEYFDLNDFDEAVLAPVSWEISRMLTSIFLAAKDMHLSKLKAKKIAASFLAEYIKVLQKGKSLVIERNTASGILKQLIVQVSERSNSDLIKSHTINKKNGRMLLIDDQKTIALTKRTKNALKIFFNNWSNQYHNGKYVFTDAAIRIAGTGSIGVDRYIILAKKIQEKSFVLLDMKESKVACLRQYVQSQPIFNNEAERIVFVQEIMQHISPALLQPLQFSNKYFVMKQLQPSADKMDLNLCKGKLKKLENILQTMAEAAASAHLRSTGRNGSVIADELIAYAEKHLEWKNKLLQFAEKYAQQVQVYYQSFIAEANV